jgi:hypothetical protein
MCLPIQSAILSIDKKRSVVPTIWLVDHGEWICLALKANRRNKLGQRQRINMYDPAVFRIHIQGELAESWSDYLGVQSMAVERDEDGFSVTAVITEPLDQAALLGIIDHLNSLGLPLRSVEYLPAEGTEP